MKRTLCIISVYRPDLFDEAVQAMGVSRSTEVVMDRRVGERRQPERAESEESRLRERRRLSVEQALREDGFAVVAVD